MRKISILFLAISVVSIASCDKFKAPKEVQINAEPELKTGERVVKNFDVDPIGTDALKAQMKAKFAPSTTTDAVETGLKAMAYDCHVDITNKNERGCDKMETKDGCIYMSVVKTLPFAPDGAQVIKVCDVGQ